MKGDLPHSRACGIRPHDHGPDCHENCPTCHGGLLGVVHPSDGVENSSEHDCSRDGHDFQMVVNFSGDLLQMFCGQCGTSWRCERL